jgi:hypothetical protein
MITIIAGQGSNGDGDGDDSEEVARFVRDGVKPEDVKERLQLAADKLAGNVPLGADASSKSLRKGIAGSAELLAIIGHGLFGLLLVVLGALFLSVGLQAHFNLDIFSIGALLLILGMWSLRAARRAARNLRAISKA